MQRFVTRLEAKEGSKEAWMVVDSDSKKYNLPERAATLNLSRESANIICEILNKEWARFEYNPW